MKTSRPTTELKKKNLRRFLPISQLSLQHFVLQNKKIEAERI